LKAYALPAPDKPAELVTLAKPEVGPRDVLVAIRAASVNGFDVYQASGGLTGMMEHRFPTVIGRDLAGVVEAVGSEAGDFAAGDEVFGFVPSAPPLEHGTFAEQISADSLVLARKPATLDFETAAALPLAGSAALDLLEAVDVKEGQTLLVVGATGGVGSFVVQLAGMRGATVIATARPDENALRDLGASQTIDYSAGGVADAVLAAYPDGITGLIDVVDQKDALTALGSVVHSGGRVASLLGAADVEAFGSRHVTATNVNAKPTPEKLEGLADLVVSGDLQVLIQAVYSLDQVQEALDAFKQGTRGKLVVRI
jgi:NADPH:quinone reductase-like Zn-dependent oxidoreductase